MMKKARLVLLRISAVPRCSRRSKIGSGGWAQSSHRSPATTQLLLPSFSTWPRAPARSSRVSTCPRPSRYKSSSCSSRRPCDTSTSSSSTVSSRRLSSVCCHQTILLPLLSDCGASSTPRSRAAALGSSRTIASASRSVRATRRWREWMLPGQRGISCSRSTASRSTSASPMCVRLPLQPAAAAEIRAATPPPPCSSSPLCYRRAQSAWTSACAYLTPSLP